MPGRVIKPLHVPSRAFARACGWFVLAGASVSAAGWLGGIPRLIDLGGNGITIKFNAAVCLILVSLALLIVSYLPAYREPVWLLSGLAAIVALATFSQYLTGIDLGLDTIFFGEAPGLPGTAAPGRMGLTGSISIAMLGTAVVLVTFSETRRYAGMLALVAFTFAAFSLCGYAFGAAQLYSLPNSTGIALQTAVMFAVLSLGIAAAVPEHGLAGIFTRDDAGAVMIRRSLLPLIGITLLTRYFVRIGMDLGYYDRELAAALVTLSEMLVFTGLLWWTAQSVSQAEARSVAAQKVFAENRIHRKIAATQKAERKRLAAELHDQIGQEVTAIRLALQAVCVRQKEDNGLTGDINLVCDQLEKLDADISDLAWQLRPAVLNSDGFTESLTRFGREWSENCGIPLELQATSGAAQLTPEIEDNLYRIAQEALNNISKHANATQAALTLSFTDHAAVLRIEDDGLGFAPAAGGRKNGKGGFGLTSIRERAATIGGTAAIETGAGEGTAITVRVPLVRDVEDPSHGQPPAREPATDQPRPVKKGKLG